MGPSATFYSSRVKKYDLCRWINSRKNNGWLLLLAIVGAFSRIAASLGRVLRAAATRLFASPTHQTPGSALLHRGLTERATGKAGENAGLRKLHLNLTVGANFVSALRA